MARRLAVEGLKIQRSRLAGDIKRLRTINTAYESKLAKVNAAIAHNNQMIVELQEKIDALGETAKLAFEIELEDPHARQTFAKSHFFPWGGKRRAILQTLRRAGKPLAASDITAILIRSFEVKLAASERAVFHYRIRRELYQLALKKDVVRVVRHPGRYGEMTWRVPEPV